MAGYRFFCPMHFTVFSGFAKEVIPYSRAKTAILRATYMAFYPFFRGMDDMRSLFSSRYLGLNGCQADYEKLKITSKRKTIGDFHMTSLKFIATKLSIDPPEILLSRCIRAVENRSILPRDMLLLKTNIHTNVRSEWVLGFVMSCWLKM